MQRIVGKCHCGNIAFEWMRPETGSSIPARRCGCTFCVKRGGVYTSHPQSTLDVRVGDPTLLNRYRFGTNTAEFLVCRACGVVPVVTSVIDGDTYAVVNVNAFEDVDRSTIDESPFDFDREDVAGRLNRRKQTWIPRVKLATGAG